MLTWTAERCGGFDWHDEAFDAAYADLEQTLFGSARTYVALAPVVGLSAGERRRPRRRHHAPPGRHRRDLAAVARGAGTAAAASSAATSTACSCSSCGASSSPTRSIRPTPPRSSPTPSQRFGSRPRARSRPAPWSSSASTSGRCASRRCCRSPRRSRAATRRGSTRSVRASPPTCANGLLLADEDRELGEALDRWELSLFSEEPFRSAQVREALGCLLGGEGGVWAASMRAAVLLAEKGSERSELLDEPPRRAARPRRPRRGAPRRSSRRSSHGVACSSSSRRVDETLLGLRPRPSSVLRVA